VYEYPITRYDAETREGGLFADYIDTLLKLKNKMIGYPDWFRRRAIYRIVLKE